MGALWNPDHEAFCQAVHKRLMLRQKRASASAHAYLDEIYEGDKTDRGAALEAVKPNARRLSNQKHIRARLKELQDFASKLAGIDSSWGMVQLKGLVEGNLADYMTPEGSARCFDLSNTPRDKMGVLAEISQDEETEVDDDSGDITRIRKVRLKLHDRIAALALMARIGGWEAPQKSELTGKDGAPLTPTINLYGRPEPSSAS